MRVRKAEDLGAGGFGFHLVRPVLSRAFCRLRRFGLRLGQGLKRERELL
jgi:hypothetical protein